MTGLVPGALASPALDAALATWERHPRPGLPQGEYALSRLAGRTRHGIYRVADGSVVVEPERHVLRMTPSPDGRRIAVEVAERADENAVLGIVDTTSSELRLHPGIRCRYDPVRWHADSAALDVVASGSGRFVTLDVSSGARRESSVPAGTRVRIFPGGAAGLLAESRPGEPTRLVDRATGRPLGAFPGVVRVLPLAAGVVVDDGIGVLALDPSDGRELWRWSDAAVRVTDLAATGERVLVAGVRAGRSVLVLLDHGRAIADRTVAHDGEPAVASGVSATGTDFLVRLEGPALPPRIVHAAELLGAPGPARRSPVRTETVSVAAGDGTSIDVVVTSPAGAVGPLPLLLTCYGGFGVPSLPVFEPTVPAWAEQGGRYAIAQIRGGGEHGPAWREAGRGANKWRGIADLAAAARGLVAAGLTRPDLLVLAGASHGGVVVASCALGAPGLCAGVVCTAAPLDLLALDAHPLGARWAGEFGDPGTPAGRDALRAISPLDRAERLPPGAAPPAFLGIVLGEDSRVAPDDTVRLVAALRRAGGDAEIWRAPRTGHGGNELDSLHLLGSAVLGFAERITTTADREGR
ncbi:prolyl oligopeptidase family serine peptidase [Jiangella endophytica]|uniref:prolyl oligopeptidase family serine peptidase n=1 Tax=Jiangella endophytica TaxID=1623398 RepID=UPI0018E53D71|nr:prolyl oligopeptidase family serine peptidase [Jiangella endophytica]